jgi:hypothetical protein
MSLTTDLHTTATDAWHGFQGLLAGTSTFAQVRDSEMADIAKDIADLTPAMQGVAKVALASFEAGASSLVGAGMTVIGPVIAEGTDQQATQVLNLANALGIPTNAILSLAEHAALTTLINGLKAGLDHIGLQITTRGVVEKPVAEDNVVTAPFAGKLA